MELKQQAVKHQMEMQQVIKEYEDKVLALLIRLKTDQDKWS